MPAIVLGVVVFFALPDGPADVAWMSAEEKRWLRERARRGCDRGRRDEVDGLSAAFTSGRVWLLCLLYFLLNVGGYGYEMWLPTIVKGFSGQSDVGVGLINAVPYAAAAVVMLWSGRHSDRTGERRGHVAVVGVRVGRRILGWPPRSRTPGSPWRRSRSRSSA